MNNQYYDYYQPNNKHLAARPHYSPTPDSGYRFMGYININVWIKNITKLLIS